MAERFRYGFIGAGRLTAAMVAGLLEQGDCPPERIGCVSRSGLTAAGLAGATGITAGENAATLAGESEAIVLALKPQQFSDIEPVLAEVSAGRLVVSVLAGLRLERLARAFPRAANLVRVMPNVAARIGGGISPFTPLKPLSEDQRGLLEGLLQAMGRSIEIPEEQMDAATAVSGSGPAYLFEFAAALRDAGIAAGLPEATSRLLTVETLLGAARLLARTGRDPEALRDEVASPKGTTRAALDSLARDDLPGIVGRAVAAAAARSRELSQTPPASGETPRQG
ncbi:MAG: pyrroline-5-carboxylate reductase [Puniceicoccaceae bacterium]|nr:MAG: pyrroline-5-carboxylate reductase [Puniceicoccaceae bacterium]